MANVEYLDRNTEGRDFITGDIHGAYDLLELAMDHLGFDPAVDRLITTGDLFNRGPQSERFLDFLERPYFYSVKGNHEEFVLAALEGRTYENEHAMDGYLDLGMEWVLSQVSDGQKDRIIEAIKSLPAVIEVETTRGRVGVVHAEVPRNMTWEEFKGALIAEDTDALQYATSSRERVTAKDDTGVEGIDRIFCGHTTQPLGPLRLGNCFYVDTGAYKAANGRSGQLTLADITAYGDSIAPPVTLSLVRQRNLSGPINLVVCTPDNPHELFKRYDVCEHSVDGLAM